MLMAHPVVLRNLLDHYQTLEILAVADVGGVPVRRKLQDVAYSLCVSTGTDDVESALLAAHDQLSSRSG